MSTAAKTERPQDRPEFMAVLGLLPPYDLEDVKAAYRDKVLAAHPDRGGDPADFIRLKEAYDRALEYAAFRGNRRAWIAAQVEPYLRQEEVVAEVLRRGGRVEVERIDWINSSWGDGFSLLAERLRRIELCGLADGDTFVAFLAEHQLPYLVGLALSGSRVSDAGLRHLAGYELLRWLDVSGTDISYPGLRAALDGLPSLEWLNVNGTGVGWWRRWMLRRAYPRVNVVAEPALPMVTADKVIVDAAKSRP